MKTTIGGDRLGSGNKQNVSIKTYNRSTHDLSYLWRSSMASGTLVPFMNLLALPGDNFDINLNCEVLTLPTIGPLFGSYKVQLDVFQIPIRLYNAGLHMNRLGIGMDMSKVFLPQVEIATNNHTSYKQTFGDNEQVNSSCIFKYLGISGVGSIQTPTNPALREFNAVPFLAYWDIYKNYYANKQEERGMVIHTNTIHASSIQSCWLRELGQGFDILDNPQNKSTAEGMRMETVFLDNSGAPNPEDIKIIIAGQEYLMTQVWAINTWDDTTKVLKSYSYQDVEPSPAIWEMPGQTPLLYGTQTKEMQIAEFPLSNIDEMRDLILQYPFNAGRFLIGGSAPSPYSLPRQWVGEDHELSHSTVFSQEGLAIKTYQSDLFNNWISTEWIDGTNGINEVTSVSTAGDSFTIDALNLANKVYNMLNRIAISGGSYDDWLDAVYTHKRSKSIESPVYHGSLIKELGFEEVISNSQALDDKQEGYQPLGTLAGRGRLQNKNKGGKMKIKIDEPSYIMGIVSLTPRIDYSQGNMWDTNLKTLNDLHKPALDAIGYQDLITDQLCYTDTVIGANDEVIFKSAGKQPAWINYMTAVNKVYGNFAVDTKEMFMVLNRRYQKNVNSGAIIDLTTYVDPTKFNHIFAETQLDAQNFWVQISANVTARRKMSAKIIPNL